jgi:MHS family proline/betaine transporter-like MFS transporter
MSKRSKTFLSAISGNILEYYDFTVYAVFSVVIGEAFFPGDSDLLKTLGSLATFAAGFITRPIGGVVFGYIADKYGRRVSLIISMLGMTIPTFTIGLIPNYSEIGIYAPIILTAMRLLQGLCISGEGAGAAIFILEHYQNLRPGLTAGIVHGSNIAGTLIATLMGYVLAKVFVDSNFAWRFAFIIGGFMGMMGFYLRLKVSETPIFTELNATKKISKVPFFEVWQNSKKQMLITCCLGAAASSAVYLVKTYIQVYYKDIMGFDNATTMQYSAFSAFLMMITMPLAGHMSDLIGRFRAVVYSTIFMFTFSMPALLLMSYSNFLFQFTGISILAIIGGMMGGSAYVFIISLFKPSERFTGIGFSYNLGVALCGGTSALVCRALVHYTGLYYSPSFYLMTISFMFLVLLYFTQNDIKSFIKSNMPDGKL